MGTRVVPLTCSIAASTAIASPQSFALNFPSANVDRIDVRIPPGPSGLMGFSINHGGGNFIPEGNGNWIIADDDFMSWPLEGAPDNGNWQIQGYNLDVVQHTIYVYFLISDLVTPNLPASNGMIGI